jgi:hypothetical protein
LIGELPSVTACEDNQLTTWTDGMIGQYGRSWSFNNDPVDWKVGGHADIHVLVVWVTALGRNHGISRSTVYGLKLIDLQALGEFSKSCGKYPCLRERWRSDHL